MGRSPLEALIKGGLGRLLERKRNYEQTHMLVDQVTSLTPLGCRIAVVETVDTGVYYKRNNTYTSLTNYGNLLSIPVRSWETTPDTDIEVKKYKHSSDGTPRIKFVLPTNGYQEKEEWILPGSACILAIKINGKPRLIEAAASQDYARFTEVELVMA